MSSQKSTPSSAAGREPQRQRGRLRVAALLEAGAAVFAEKGYEAATMTEIAARANAAIGSLYQFFPSKEMLADALLAAYGERLETSLQGIVEGAAGMSPAALAQALVALMLDLRSERAAAIALFDVRRDATDRRSRFRQAIRREIAAVIRAVSPDRPDADIAAMAVMIQYLLKVVPALAEEDAMPDRDLVDEVREVIRLYLTCRGRAASP